MAQRLVVVSQCHLHVTDTQHRTVCFTLVADGGDSCTMWKYLTPENYTLKNNQDGKFYIKCISC